VLPTGAAERTGRTIAGAGRCQHCCHVPFFLKYARRLPFPCVWPPQSDVLQSALTICNKPHISLEDSAITVPDTAGVTINDAVSVFLNSSGSISHTVNNAGTTVQKGTQENCPFCVRILSFCFRRASKTQLMPSPGNPNIVSTPQASNRPTRKSDASVTLAPLWKDPLLP
jgi:hypothetical protein